MNRNPAAVYDTETWNVIQVVDACRARFHVAALSSDGRLFAVSPRAPADDVIHRITIWDIPSNKAIRAISVRNDPLCLAFSPDGTRLAIGTDRDCQIWDVARLEDPVILDNVKTTVVAFSPDGLLLATSYYSDVLVWHWMTREQVSSFYFPGYASRVVFLPDGERAASVVFHNSVHGVSDVAIFVWQIGTGKCIAKVRSHDLDSSTTLLVGNSTSWITSVGKFSIDGLTSGANTTSPQQTDALNQIAYRRGLGISSDECWITWNEKKLLFMPRSYRPELRHTLVIGTTVVMRQKSGRVIFLGFSNNDSILS